MPHGKNRSNGKPSDEQTCCPNAAGCQDVPCSSDPALLSGRDHSGEFSSVQRAFYILLVLTRTPHLWSNPSTVGFDIDFPFSASLPLQPEFHPWSCFLSLITPPPRSGGALEVCGYD